PGEVKARPDVSGAPLPDGAAQRLGTTRFRHDATAIASSPDGKLLASGGRDNVIRLFDAATGKEIRRLTGHLPRSYNGPADAKNAVDLLVSATGQRSLHS